MRLILHIFLPLLLIAACPAYAADVGAVSPWAKTPQAAVRLVAAPATNATSGPDARTIRLGLEFDLAAGWKTYWRSPGDAGFPASIDWKGSSNVKPGPLDWPVPTRYSLQGLETFGYEGRLVLPLTAMRTDPTKPTHLSATVDFLTCATLCVPNHVDLALDLALGAVPAGQAPLLDHWMARVPTGFRTDLTIISAASGGIGRSAFLDILVGAAPPMASPDVMIEGDGAVVSRPPQVIPQSPVTAVLRLTDPSDKDGALAKLSGKHIAITVVDRATLGAPTPRAVTHADVPVLHAETAAQSANSVPLSRGILLAALLGGLILNVMPCVLPVLSLKVLGLAGLNHFDRRRRRLGFVAGAAGIVVSFMALGIVLAVAKAAGQSIGWGVQFQHPLFLSTLAAITTAFAGNLFGWFEVPMPSLGLPASRSGEPSLLGHFVTGIFATVLATPCSAPFLGTAVGFALAGSIGDIMAVFLCLGLGFALPQILLAMHPELGGLLPRPGRWMIVLRRVLGLGLLGTALWLIDVVAAQAGWTAAAIVLALAAIGLGCIWAMRRHGPKAALAAGVVLIAAALTPARLTPAQDVSVPDASAATASAAGWHAYDAAAISGAVASGKTVLVDVTARWCLTCQVNERLVLDKGPVRERLADPSVIAMRADWTRPDPAIEALLHDYGRFGIPFSIVFGPKAPQGIVLPEVLTSGAVLEALDKAGAV